MVHLSMKEDGRRKRPDRWSPVVVYYCTKLDGTGILQRRISPSLALADYVPREHGGSGTAKSVHVVGCK